MEISQNLLTEAHANPKMEILSEPFELGFNSEGNLW
jgi:hypothetical protein